MTEVICWSMKIKMVARSAGKAAPITIHHGLLGLMGLINQPRSDLVGCMEKQNVRPRRLRGKNKIFSISWVKENISLVYKNSPCKIFKEKTTTIMVRIYIWHCHGMINTIWASKLEINWLTNLFLTLCGLGVFFLIRIVYCQHTICIHDLKCFRFFLYNMNINITSFILGNKSYLNLSQTHREHGEKENRSFAK